MQEYFITCQRKAFTAPNDFNRVNEIREAFYQWHLAEIIRKFSKKKRSDLVYVLLTWPELKTASAMFQRIDCDTETRHLQGRFM